MRYISNEEFNLALENKDNAKLFRLAVRNIKIPYDEYKSCKYIALWLSLSKFDSSKKSKFSTYLFNMSRWVTLNRLRSLKNREGPAKPSSYKNSHFKLEIEDILSKDEFNLIDRRFFYSQTLSEISKDTLIPLESVRRKLKEILKKLSIKMT